MQTECIQYAGVQESLFDPEDGDHTVLRILLVKFCLAPRTIYSELNQAKLLNI
jgi:hypothetical protein